MHANIEPLPVAVPNNKPLWAAVGIPGVAVGAVAGGLLGNQIGKGAGNVVNVVKVDGTTLAKQ